MSFAGAFSNWDLEGSERVLKLGRGGGQTARVAGRSMFMGPIIEGQFRK